MEKSLICRGLTISQEGGPIWKKMSRTYDAKVPKVTVYIRSKCGERCIIKRIDILEPTIEMVDIPCILQETVGNLIIVSFTRGQYKEFTIWRIHHVFFVRPLGRYTGS